MAQKEDRPFLGRDIGERLLDPGPEEPDLGCQGRVRGGPGLAEASSPRVEDYILSRLRDQGFVAQMVDRSVIGDAVEPGAELGTPFERLKTAERFQENLLGDVLGVGRISHHVKSKVIHLFFVGLDQLPERGRVAPAEPLDELFLFGHPKTPVSHP